jgi:hypothetical protein
VLTSRNEINTQHSSELSIYDHIKTTVQILLEKSNDQYSHIWDFQSLEDAKAEGSGCITMNSLLVMLLNNISIHYAMALGIRECTAELQLDMLIMFIKDLNLSEDKRCHMLDFYNKRAEGNLGAIGQASVTLVGALFITLEKKHEPPMSITKENLENYLNTKDDIKKIVFTAKGNTEVIKVRSNQVKFIRDFFRFFNAGDTIDLTSLQRVMLQSSTYGGDDLRLQEHIDAIEKKYHLMLYKREIKNLEKSLNCLRLHAIKLQEPYQYQTLELVAWLTDFYKEYLSSKFQEEDYKNFRDNAKVVLNQTSQVFMTKRSHFKASTPIPRMLRALSCFEMRNTDTGFHPDWRFFKTKTGQYAVEVEKNILKMKPKF